jgi:hypothetical protein
VDKRALKILSDTYWSPKGWKDERHQKVSHEDFAYAKAAGVMFDPLKADHGEVLQRLVQARDAVEPEQVANAFLASLSTRRLDLRSALGSFAVFRHLEDHAPRPYDGRCGICGHYLSSRKAEDLNVLNFERFKWGGVRHDDPMYAALDLELFLREELATPTIEDIHIFNALIAAIDAAPPRTTAATLHRLWVGTLKSNKQERDVLVAILGFCGILETVNHQGHRKRFIPEDERDLPDRHFTDMAYPACWWSRLDGINRDALHEWFGHVL